MRTWDRLIFFAIAVFLGIIAARSLVGYPVQAAKEPAMRVNIVEIGSRAVFKDEIIKR